MKWLRNRFLLMSYFLLLTLLVALGCTQKEDPAEVLILCENHSCGDLKMITADTSSEGYHYLNPSLSPDGTRVLFTADWWALPSDPRLADDQPFTINRQLLVIPVQERISAQESLEDQGAELIRLNRVSMVFGTTVTELSGILDDQKGDPTWGDDNTIIFWVHTIRGGARLFQADISDPSDVTPVCLYQEPTDFNPSPSLWQHMAPSISPDKEWLLFTRSGCAIPDSFETCTGLAIWALQMSTAGSGPDAETVAFPVTSEISRIETPRWSPDGNKILFSGSLDMGNSGTGAGTELFTVDFDTTGLADYVADGTPMALDRNVDRLTYTSYLEGDPIVGVLNSSATYSANMSEIYFVSTRRAPSITLHDRNIWRIPADGSLPPEILFFSRADDVDPYISPDGSSIIFSSQLGFPGEMLNRLEEEAYQRLKEENPNLSEVEARSRAKADRQLLEFFHGVMSHLYLYRNW